MVHPNLAATLGLALFPTVAVSGPLHRAIAPRTARQELGREDRLESSDPAALVDGFAITEAALERHFQVICMAGMKLAEHKIGRPLPASKVDELREEVRSTLVEQLIDSHLLEREAKESGVFVTDAEVDAYFDRAVEDGLNMACWQRGMDREEYFRSVEESVGLTLAESLEHKRPEFRVALLSMKLIESRRPEECRVTEDEIVDTYREGVEQLRFMRPALMSANIVLIRSDTGMTDSERADARKRAEEVLALARAGSDFDAIVESSTFSCSHLKLKSELGEQLADAAFELEIGAISEIVETPFGFAIVRCTDRKEAYTIPLESARAGIQTQLRIARTRPLYEELRLQLREAADIVYGPARQRATETPESHGNGDSH